MNRSALLMALSMAAIAGVSPEGIAPERRQPKPHNHAREIERRKRQEARARAKAAKKASEDGTS